MINKQEILDDCSIKELMNCVKSKIQKLHDNKKHAKDVDSLFNYSQLFAVNAIELAAAMEFLAKMNIEGISCMRNAIHILSSNILTEDSDKDMARGLLKEWSHNLKVSTLMLRDTVKEISGPLDKELSRDKYPCFCSECRIKKGITHDQ